MIHPDEIAALAACETPLSDHVASFWKLLETETVHLSVNIRRVIGHDAPDGPTVYYDCSTFSDEVAKELVRLSATSPGDAVREAWQTARKYVSSHADASGAAAAIIAMDAALAPAEKACKDHPSRRCLPEECCLTAPAEKAGDDLAERINERLSEGDGYWQPCSGCYQSNEGYPIGTYSNTFRCELGIGCSECGGIGAVWDNTDYSEIGADLATPTPPSADVAWLIQRLRSWEKDPAATHRVNGRTRRLLKEAATMLAIQSAAPGGGTEGGEA